MSRASGSQSTVYTHVLRPKSEYTTDFDDDVANYGVLLLLDYRKELVEFQFPPKITGDSRRITFETGKDKGMGRDPILKYGGNTSRDFTMQVEYVVEHSDSKLPANKPEDFNTDVASLLELRWNIDRIKYNINLLRGYFTSFKDTTTGQSAYGARFKHTLITGVNWSGVVLKGFSTTYEGPLIGDNPRSAMPLKTTITVEMSTLTGRSADLNQFGNFPKFPNFNQLWY
jgi:hypothetical protein